MNRISDRFTTYIINSMGLNDYSSIVKYAIDAIVEDFLTLFIAIIITFTCFKEISSTIIFAIAFAFFRQFAGGIHAITHMGCTIVTVCIFCICAWIIRDINVSILLGLTIISSIGIWMTSPVEAVNKKINLSQLWRNQRIARKILIFYWVTILLLFRTEIANAIQIAIIMVFVLQLLDSCVHGSGECKNFPKERNLRANMTMPIIILSICNFVCQNTVQNVSRRWIYQDDIPDDIQRKFDNM